MDGTAAFKKAFLAIVVLVAIVVAGVVAKAVYDEVYESIYESVARERENQIRADMGADPLAPDEAPFGAGGNGTHDAPWLCPESNATSFAFVVILGMGNHDLDSYPELQERIRADPKTTGLLVLDYDEKDQFVNITPRVAAQINEWLETQDAEEIILIGTSSGGIVASQAINLIETERLLRVHTIASSLRGYDRWANEQMLEGMEGIEYEIGKGIGPFDAPDRPAVVTHHKTPNDMFFRSYCGDFASYCDPVIIQDNNVPGASDHFYWSESHESAMPHVIGLIVDCFLGGSESSS